MIDERHNPNKLANFRELGGIAVTGGRVPEGLLFRADDLATIDDQEAQRVQSHNISLIIDLRSPDEAAITGRGPLANTEIRYSNLPFLGQASAPHQIMADAAEAGFTARLMGIWYERLLSDAAELVAQAIKLIAETEGPVVFHCAAGKDRTGLLAASLLSLLGASDEDIVADYTRTQAAMPGVLARLRANQPTLDTDQLLKAGAMLRADAEAMEVFLQLVAESGLSIETRLKNAGLNDETIQQLRDKLIA
jgi:protein tyrosine/serine phosphatase